MSSLNRSSQRSFTDAHRNVQPPPRLRHPSLTHAAIQDLLNHPPSANMHPNPKFAGREWRDVIVGELVSADDVRWIEIDSSVEEATMDAHSTVPVSIFDFNDLNAYLLVVVGLSRPEGNQVALFNDIMSKAQTGTRIPLREIQPVCFREAVVTLNSNDNLSQAIELLGSGIHQILITGQDGTICGIVSQLRMVEFFWNEGVNFPTIDGLYPAMLRDLGVGTKQIISVNSDVPLTSALITMYEEGLSSIAVVDHGQNVVGNISTKDVRHLTSSSSAPLLSESCMHFISIILNERGLEKGQDTFPVFYVNPYSTLAHTVAKLVATKSHRMWVVESASPSPPVPATPTSTPHLAGIGGAALGGGTPPCPIAAAAPVPVPAMGGARLSGKLTGVVSLTDILNMFAKSTGLHPSDPREQRARRRRSSSSSIRPSLDSTRPSIDIRR
ncbi:Protein SDS23 [Escovopsis weberi]|uniref:Protein SDS23 n=1 Tax=Escovopsis weberi TaxID=150374 RepID=A0A0M9VXP7_ESCWE|nr:Protein SDS23 [Escovopsis weberi]